MCPSPNLASKGLEEMPEFLNPVQIPAPTEIKPEMPILMIGKKFIQPSRFRAAEKTVINPIKITVLNNDLM